MKLKYILAIIPVMLIASCQKDFLDTTSISTFDLNYVYSNVDDARNGVNAIYTAFDVDPFRSRLMDNFTGNTDIEHQSGWTSSSDRYQIWNLDASTTNGDLNNVWKNAYQAIRDANIAIEGITSSGNLDATDPTVKTTFNQLLGEAYTLRAYWYSMLIYYWGDVPYSTHAPVAGENFDLPKTNRNEILTKEIQALMAVEENMQWADALPHRIEQVNREYTLGMIARLALQRGGYYLKPNLTMVRDSDYLEYYQIAKQYTKKLMDLKDRPLNPDFRNIFLTENSLTLPSGDDDVLFEVPFAIGNGDVGWNIGVKVTGGSGAAHDYGSGSNYMSMPPTYYMSFDSKDERRAVTCGLFEVTKEDTKEHVGINISQGKWNRRLLPEPPGILSAKGTGINWPMMRYSDVILMYAEAENELNGPTMEAQNALKRVRQRAFDEADWGSKVDTYVAQVSASKSTFLNAIVNERAWEFGGEMTRKYDLIRWGIYSQKMQETIDGLKQLADDAFDGSGTGPDYMYWKVDETGEFVILNPDTKIIAPPDDTWTQTAFLKALHDDTLTYKEWITRDWENYVNGPAPGVARYIFPLPSIAIDNSKNLSNDGYGF